MIAPDVLANIVRNALADPTYLLTDGFGRLSIGAVRRIRLNHIVAVDTMNYLDSPWEEYRNFLSEDGDFLLRAINLLDTYLHAPNESWRAVWLLYILDEIYANDTQLRDLLHFASTNDSLELPRLWANKLLASNKSAVDLEELHELGYLEGGTRYYGSNSHS